MAENDGKARENLFNIQMINLGEIPNFIFLKKKIFIFIFIYIHIYKFK